MSCRLRHLWHPLTGSHVQEPEETFERDFVRGGAEQRGRACKDGPAEGETASKEGGTEERGGGGPQSQLPQDARQDGIAHHDRVHGGHGELDRSQSLFYFVPQEYHSQAGSTSVQVLHSKSMQ